MERLTMRPDFEKMLYEALKEVESMFQDLRNKHRDELLNMNRQLQETRTLLGHKEQQLVETQSLLFDMTKQLVEAGKISGDDTCKGKIASGKHCKRTTDSVGKRYTMSHNPEHGSYTAELLRDVGLDSPEVTLSAPGSSMPQYYWSQNIYGDNVDLSGFTVPQGTNVHQSSAVEDQTCVESPQKKRLRNSKGSDGGIEKTKAKKGEYDMLENFVSAKEELKTKQINSCKDIQMVQMERNDPKNDPYWMPSIQKLKTLKLTPSEQDKMMNYLHANPVNPAVFMTVDDAVLAEIIKRAVSPGEEFSLDREHYFEEEDEGEQYGEEKGEEAEL